MELEESNYLLGLFLPLANTLGGVQRVRMKQFSLFVFKKKYEHKKH